MCVPPSRRPPTHSRDAPLLWPRPAPPQPVWRLLTGHFWHAGILHLALNLTALVPTASGLERGMGSVRFAHMLLVLVVAQDLLHIALAYGARWGFLSASGRGGGKCVGLARAGVPAHASAPSRPRRAARPPRRRPPRPHPAPRPPRAAPPSLPPSILGSAARACAAGCSGVVFALMVVENAALGGATRSVFGVVDVPAPLLPWALMALVQLVVPRASLLGHLAGLLAGEAWASGRLEAAALADAAVARAEAHPLYCRGLAARVGGAVPAQPGARHAWQAARACAAAGGEGSGSLEAAAALARRAGAAVWARVPPASRESALQAWLRARLAVLSAWQQAVAALPPQVVESCAAAAAAAAPHVRPAWRWLRGQPARSHGSDGVPDEEQGLLLDDARYPPMIDLGPGDGGGGGGGHDGGGHNGGGYDGGGAGAPARLLELGGFAHEQLQAGQLEVRSVSEEATLIGLEASPSPTRLRVSSTTGGGGGAPP